MLVFRSGEHLKRWTAAGNPAGETMTVEQQWTIAREWFAGRHLEAWSKRSPEEAEAILRRAGLTSPFWKFRR